MVAVVIFTLGGAFATYEGIKKLGDPHEINSPQIAIGILALGVLLEGWSFYTAIQSAKQVKGNASWRTYLRETKQAELPVVLLEDLGALIGLAVAMLGVTLSLVTGDPRYDAAGSIVIGILLGVIAVFLCIEMHSLIIGEAASTEHSATIERAIRHDEAVAELVHLRTMHLGPDQLLVGAKIEFSPSLTFLQLAQAIDRVEIAIRKSLPLRAMIYLEPALRGSRSSEVAPGGG